MESSPGVDYRFCWRFIAVAIVALSLAACTSPTSEDNQAPKVVSENANQITNYSDAKVVEEPSFFPTAMGTRWKWRKTTTIGDGKGAIPATVITDDLESKVVGYDEIDGARCARVEVTDSWGTVVQTEYFSLSPEGLFRYGMNEERFRPPIKLLALPAKVGATWSGKYTIQDVRVHISGLIAAQESVTVPAGRFDAVRVEFNPGLLKTISWYAAGIGVVKQSIDKPSLSQRDDLELVEFGLGDSSTVTER